VVCRNKRQDFALSALRFKVKKMAAAVGIHVKKFWKNVSQHPYSGFSLNNSSEGSIFNQLAVFSSTVLSRQLAVGSWQLAVGGG
jgi:hypothetical protein